MDDRTRTAARRVFDDCLAVDPGERVLVVHDDAQASVGRTLARAAPTDATTTRVEVSPSPARVAADSDLCERMCAADACVTTTDPGLAHVPARQTATDAGTRVATLPGVDERLLREVIDIDYDRTAAAAAALREPLFECSEIRLETPAGCLEMAIAGRQWYVETGRCRGYGNFMNLPAGEVSTRPRAVDGRFRIDGSVARLGTVSEPITVRVENGRATAISNPELRTLLDSAAPGGRNVAEFGIGVNPAATVTGRPIVDEKAAGTVHVAFGDDTSLNGTTDCGLHVDTVVETAELIVDGSHVDLESLIEGA